MKKQKDPTRVKAGRKARRKGRRGEFGARDLCRALFYPNGDGTVERTPMSGAWHGTPVMTGDLVFLRNDEFDHKRFPFFFEVKNVSRKSVAPFKLLAGEYGDIEEWLRVASMKAYKGELYAIVMWKVNNSCWFVTIDLQVMYEIEKLLTMKFNMAFPHWKTNKFIIMPWISFEKWCKPFVELLNR